MSAAVSNKLPRVYGGREQTFVKHLILREYIERVGWNILSFADEFVFVDGFSGPWKARTPDFADTSFGIAINKLRLLKTRYPNKRLRCVFVEERAHAFRQLSTAAAAAQDLSALAMRGKLEDRVPEVMSAVGGAFALTFIDPTGWNIDLARLAPLLRHRGEVLVNFMYEHFRRFTEDRREDIRRSQDLPFGGPSWREKLAELRAGGWNKEDALLELFKQSLKQVGHFNHVASARVLHPYVNKSHFYLVYGTRHPKGLVEFRGVEKKALRAEQESRKHLQYQRKVDRTGVGDLFAEEATPAAQLATSERHRNVTGAAMWIERTVSGTGIVSYDKLWPSALEQFSITKPEFGEILLKVAADGGVRLEGLTSRGRPSTGVTVHPMSG
jgi:three-Cys-motif partner protein